MGRVSRITQVPRAAPVARVGRVGRVAHMARMAGRGRQARDLARRVEQVEVVLERRRGLRLGSAVSVVVLRRMGLSEARAIGSLRISLGRGTTEQQIDTAIDTIERAVRTVDRGDVGCEL